MKKYLLMSSAAVVIAYSQYGALRVNFCDEFLEFPPQKWLIGNNKDPGCHLHKMPRFGDDT